jgi:MFS family permease
MSAAAIRLTALVFGASVTNMLGSSAFVALLPDLVRLWGLSNTEAGWIGGIYFGGYALAVPVLVALTDRVDARRVYLAASALTGSAFFGFTLLADGFWSALVLHAMAGAGLAGTYMPGLKMLTDRLEGPAQVRAVPYYTVGFSGGISLSFLVAGTIEPWFGWRAAFGVGALGPAIALMLVGFGVAARPVPNAPSGRFLLDFRPVFANRQAMAYVLGYTGHTWELMAQRAWTVAFLLFAAGRHGIDAESWNLPAIATVIVLAGIPASILGAELAVRSDRMRLVRRIMIVTVLLAFLTVIAVDLPFWIVVALLIAYGYAVMSDSAALTAGAVQSARPGERGATIAVHSTIGFTGGFLGPLAAGVVLDLAGGATSHVAWICAFAAITAGSAVGPFLLRGYAPKT